MLNLKSLVLSVIIVIGLFFSQVKTVYAGEVLGIHILHPYEINDAIPLLRTDKNKDEWVYITIPYGLDDVPKQSEWQSFFDQCKDAKLIPIVRLTTRAEGENWKIPTTMDIVHLASGLSRLHWPREERLVIAFNEPNHAHEWGGKVLPQDYANSLKFSLEWFKTEGKNYRVLPAAMDLAAPNSSSTMEAFNYWKQVFEYDPELVHQIDDWNSHSYPNPGFSSSPTLNTQNSMRGFQHELSFLKKYTDREFGVYITETGWIENASTSKWLKQYYAYAQQHIWSDSRVKAVTPFLLRGAPGPFTGFSFLDKDGKKTRQFEAYRQVIESVP